MKIKQFASILALFLAGVAAPPAAAQPSGQSIIGSYQFSFEDGHTKFVEFDARAQAGFAAIGHIFFSDETEINYRDLDGAGDPQGSYRGFYLKANFDGLVILKNQAVASGTVSDSSIPSLIGQRLLLTVEDNGDGSDPDKLTWGVFKSADRGWTASDAELEKDPGVGMSWVATDAELSDDAGVRMPRDESVTTHSYPLASYTFDNLERWSGYIRVQP